MNELPLHIRKSIGRYEPVETEGLVLYPIKVDNYYEFLAARPSIEFMQQRLPIHLMSEPLLSAYFRLDSGTEDGQEPTGLFMSALLALSLALRLKPEGSIEERIKQFSIVIDPNDRKKLKYVRFIKDGEEQIEITPVQFQRLRPIIAAQNGIELMDDSANPELVDAERDLAEAKAPKLEIDIESYVSAAAIVANKDESEIYEWAILKLQRRLESAKMVLDYVISGIGETQGTKWKGGNPHPNPWFKRKKDGNAGLMPIESFASGQGLQAIRNSNATDNEKAETGSDNNRLFNAPNAVFPNR